MFEFDHDNKDKKDAKMFFWGVKDKPQTAN